MNDIYIIGYYDHKNLGDEQYKITFTQILCYYFNYTKQPIFVDCDKIEQYSFRYTDLILLGGGDILNRYFLDKIKKVFEYKSNPIIAVSVGLPYTDLLLDTKYLDFIDAFFVRTLQDIKIFQPYRKVYYIPDISYMLNMNMNMNMNKVSTEQFVGLKDINKKIIAISLSRHMFHTRYPEEYKNCISSWVQLICVLIQRGYAVIMIPFNTNTKSSNENDQLVQKQIYKNVPEQYRSFLIDIQNTLTPEEMMELHEYVYFSIPMRFHAVLFSIYKNVPMIPVYTTRKIQNVLLDCQWPLSYSIPKNEYDVPTHIDVNSILSQIDKLVNDYSSYKSLLEKAQESVFENHMYSSLVLLKDTISQTQPKQRIFTSEHSYSKKLFDQVNETFGIQDFRTIQDLKMKQLISQYVSYFLTRGLFDSKYTYGLLEKMFKSNYDYETEWSWVIEDDHERRIQHLYNNPKGWININFIHNKSFHQDNPYQVHRSGWQYVYENLKTYHNNNASIFLDLYLDRTFHWNYEINKKLEIIPYQQSWVGFVHHTFDTSFSTYNNVSLLNNRDFIHSLKYCKGLIVLSQYQRELWIQELVKRGIKHTFKIYALVHPTEDQIKKFSYSEFINQKQPKIINIGGWLRNIVAFYKLDLGIIQLHEKCCFSRELQFEKVAIKGKMMNNYFPPTSGVELKSLENLESCLEYNSSISRGPCISRDNTKTNHWISVMNQEITKLLKSVNIIEHVSNSKYDNLLSENIVFIYLVDASAVNTLNECIVRNTPILVNRHPAVVELLGEKYPLYFDTHYTSFFDLNQSIRKIFQKPKIILKAHQYLVRLDKNPYKIQTFIDHLEKIIAECNH